MDISPPRWLKSGGKADGFSYEIIVVVRITKIFDPADGFTPYTDPLVVTDSSVAKRDGRWWMYLAGKVKDRDAIQLFSASLPQDARLSATGWTPVRILRRPLSEE